MVDAERTTTEQEVQKAKVTIVLFKWKGWSNFYQVQHVNAISRMFTHYLKIPYRIVLLTDDMEADSGAEVDEVLPVPPDPKGLKLLTHVNCFKRLNLFDPEYASQFGTEFVISIDLDTLIRGDITHLISSAMDYPYGLCIVRGRWAAGAKPVNLNRELRTKAKLPPRPYNGAFFMIRVGSNAQVYNDFHPVNTPIEIRNLRWVGSDQCAISLLAPNALTLGPEHGMYFFGQYLQERRRNPKAKALVLNFAGKKKPWTKPVKFEASDIWKEYMRFLDAATV